MEEGAVGLDGLARIGCVNKKRRGMRFCKLYDFNLSMLAKKGEQIIMNPDA